MNANLVDFYLIITYPGSSTQILMSGNDRAIAATIGNENLLLEMGERLLNENIIASYQLVQVVGSEVNRM